MISKQITGSVASFAVLYFVVAFVTHDWSAETWSSGLRAALFLGPLAYLAYLSQAEGGRVPAKFLFALSELYRESTFLRVIIKSGAIIGLVTLLMLFTTVSFSISEFSPGQFGLLFFVSFISTTMISLMEVLS